MCRRVAVSGLGLTFLVLLSVMPTKAADDVLKLVPDSALGLVVIQCPSDADAKLQELGRQMQLPVPSLLALLKQEMGIRDGLDAKGTTALVLLPPAGGTPWPTPILLVPVSDYGKFVAQFQPDDTAADVTEIEVKGESMWIRPIGGYAALTDRSHKETLAEGLKLAGQAAEALAPWHATLAENDVAVVILQPGIKLMSTHVQAQMQTMQRVMAQAGEQAKEAAAVFDAYAKVFQAAEKEMTGVGFGARLDQQGGLHATKRARLVPGGEWAGLAAQFQPTKESLLSGLPNEPFVIAGGGAIPPSIWDPMMAFSLEMMKNMRGLYGLSEEQIERMPTTSLAAMKRIRSMSLVLGVPPSGTSLYSKFIGVMQVDDTNAFMADYEKALKEYALFAKDIQSPILTATEIEKSEIDGTAALQITTEAPQLSAAQQSPQYDKMMELLFGPERKLTAWLVPVDEDTVVLGYVNKDFIQSTLQAIKQGSPGLAGDADVLRTAALLPTGAPTVAFWNPQTTVDFVRQMLPVFQPGGGNARFEIPAFDKTPPIGLAVTAAPNELQGHMVVPAEVLKAIGQYVSKLKSTGAARP